MSDWKEYKLDAVYDFASGLSKGREEFGFGFGFLAYKDVFNNYFLPDTLTSLVNSSVKERETCSIKRGDVFLTRTSETEEELGLSSVALKDYPDATFNGFTKRLRPKGAIEVLPEYAGYYFRSPKFRAVVSNMASITTRASLNNEMLAALSIVVPPFPEQQVIAEVLSSLDNKIDLLHRQNKTLEALAETLFRQWFVEEAEESWESGKLMEFGNIICGKTPSKKVRSYFGGDIPFIKIPDMHGKTFIFETEDSLTEEGANSQANKYLPGKSICVSCIATVGLVSMNESPSQTNQQINSIIPQKDFYRYFIYLKLKTMKDELLAMAGGGTATDNLNTGDFSNISMLKPSENVLRDFHRQVEPMYDKVFFNQDQIRTLTKLRDTLLPKLMIGEVRVEMSNTESATANS